MSEEQQEEEKKVLSGTVKYFNQKKYFGFIEREDKEKDLFFHGSNVLEKRELTEGEKVNFEITGGEKGPEAIGIQRIEKEDDQLDLPPEEKEEKKQEKEGKKERKEEKEGRERRKEGRKGKEKEKREKERREDREEEEEEEEERKNKSNKG